MNYLRIFSRIFVGIVFTYSGFVKVIDPLGSNYKFIDYFTAFHLDFMTSLALPLAVTMSVAELLIGMSLIAGFRMKVSSWAVLGFMAFFTPLTLVLALLNPVSDCGCFGDALILTNWETFGKNVIILAFVLIIFLGRKKYYPVYKPFTEWILVSMFVIAGFVLSFYCYNHLPIIDFRPYKVGTYISEDMVIPEGVPQDIYENEFRYKNIKTGEIKEFNNSNYPWADTLNWAFVDMKSKLIKEGYHPPIHDFSIQSIEEGNDIADLILEDDKYTFILVAHNLEKSNLENQSKINRLAEYCLANNMHFICLTSTLKDQINTFKAKTKAPYTFYNSDEIMLKTTIRSNPGLILLKKGTVLANWAHKDIPDVNQLKSNLLSMTLKEQQKQNNMLIYLCFSLGFILFLTLAYILLKKNPQENIS